MHRRSNADEGTPRGGRKGVSSAEIKGHVSTLQQQLNEIQRVVRSQIDTDQRVVRAKQGEALNEDFSDDNPYSRLMAAQLLGHIPDYERIRGVSVAVVGCGGVGIQVCEMLARCGVGMLSLYDRDTVKMSHMGRMFFRPEHIGWTKTQVSRHFLTDINPDVLFRTFSYDIQNHFDEFVVSLRRGSLDESAPVDLVVCCVDNQTARLVVNNACHELNTTCIAAVVDVSGLAASIQVVTPGRTACLQCEGAAGEEEGKEGDVHVGLPSTDAVVAGLMGNLALKFLLGFGEVSNVSVNLLTNGMDNAKTTPNPSCPNKLCCKRQENLARMAE